MAGRRGASPLATAEQFAGSDVFDCLGCAGEQVGSALSILQSRRAFPVRRGYLRRSYSDETWAAMAGRLSSVD